MKRAWLMAVALMLPASLPAQDARTDLRESQLRLERIRQEKQQLQEELELLRSRVRDAAREANNIAQQRATSARAVRELDFQAEVINRDVENTARQLALTHARLQERNTALKQRLRSIYKRGQMHAIRVLLSAESFGGLMNRYKYLHLVSLNDRMVVLEIARLERQLAAEEQSLRRSLAQLESLREEKLDELRQLEVLEGRRTRALAQMREQERTAANKLEQLLKDEARIAGLITELERRRREAERRGVRTTAGSGLTTRDLGALDWPVEGSLVFRFGPERRPNGVVLRYNGIGIAAAPGTPVKAVETGTVEIAGPLEGYGPSVVVGHGNGYYTLYLRLRNVSVRPGERLNAGQLLGTVGGEGTPEGPHLEFQVRTPSASGAPIPVDPLNWLRARAGTR